jgi:hypothetical protein
METQRLPAGGTATSELRTYVSLLPREHGAYGQMAFPIVTSFGVAGVTTPALLIAIGVIAGFLAHEPLLVLLGRRGVRVTRELGRCATVWLVFAVPTAIGTELVALFFVPLSVRWSLFLPLVPAAPFAVAVAVKREKSWQGEVAIALVFSLVAVPICLAADASTGTALAVGIAFAVIFVTGTLAVRVIVLESRRGGNPHAARATRVTVLMLTTAAGVGLVSTAVDGLLSWTTLVAAAPGLGGASWLTLFPPPPTRLRTVGWALVITSAAAAVILMVGRAGGP